MNFRICLIATALTAMASRSEGAAITMSELMTSYAWGASRPVSGVLLLNLWNDSTGALLTADNGDLWDVAVQISSSAGSLGAGSLAYDATADSLVASHSFTGPVPASNPGTRVLNRVTLSFASHVTVTDLNADWSSLNTAGITWEVSRLAALTPSGTFFSPEPTIAPYLAHATVGGSPSAGFFLSDARATVSGVGTAATSAGTTSGALNNLTGTSGNSFLDYTDLGLPAGTQIGGFEWLTILEDVRGTGNAGSSSLTATLTSFMVAGRISAAVVPEPGTPMALLTLSGAALASGRRRRRLPARF